MKKNLIKILLLLTMIISVAQAGAPEERIAWCGSRVKSAVLLANGDKAVIEQKGDRVWLHGFPEYPPDPYLNVIELTFYGKPKASVPSYR